MHQNIRATSLSFVKKSRNQKSFWQAHYTKPKIFQNAVYVSFMKKDVFLCVFATCNYDFIQSLILRILSIILIWQWNIIFDSFVLYSWFQLLWLSWSINTFSILPHRGHYVCLEFLEHINYILLQWITSAVN